MKICEDGAVAGDLLGRLATVVGERWLVRDGDGLEEYGHDATFMESAPLCAVRPASTEEVAAVVREAAAAGVPVVARGAGTSLVGGPVPLAAGIVLSLDRLTEIEIDVPNTVAVAA